MHIVKELKKSLQWFTSNYSIWNLNLMRTLNIFNSYLARNLGISIFKPIKPTMLFVEVVRGCNFRCVMCPAKSYKLSFMSLDIFKEVVNQFDDATFIYPYGLGEPFLNKHIYEMISYAANKGISVISFSNFSKVDAEKLVNAGPRKIFASIDSADKGEFSEIRKNGDISAILDKVKEIQQVKKQKGKKFPEIGFSITMMDRNANSVEKIINLGLSMGIREFLIQTLFKEPFLTSFIDEGFNEPSSEDVRKIYNLKTELQRRYKDLKINIISYTDFETGDSFYGYCLFGYNSIFIDVFGNMYFCGCAQFFPNGAGIIGNLKDGAKNLLMKKQRILDNFRSSPPKWCRECPNYFRGKNGINRKKRNT